MVVPFSAILKSPLLNYNASFCQLPLVLDESLVQRYRLQNLRDQKRIVRLYLPSHNQHMLGRGY
jgi:hypothetical protein